MTQSTRAGPEDLLPDLFRQYRATGERHLRNEIVERHRHLADGAAQRFRSRGIAVDDLRQTALLAMVRAVDRYDPDRGASFATFVGRTMEGELKRTLRDKAWSVRPPRAAQERYLALRRRDEELTHSLGRSPTIAELADALGVSLDDVLDGLEAGAARSPGSLVRVDDDDGEVELGEVLGVADSGFDRAEERLVVANLIEQLDARSRQVIELRYFERLGQEEIARRVGVSQSYLSRMLRTILSDLRALLDADDLGEAGDLEEPFGVDRGRP